MSKQGPTCRECLWLHRGGVLLGPEGQPLSIQLDPWRVGRGAGRGSMRRKKYGMQGDGKEGEGQDSPELDPQLCPDLGYQPVQMQQMPILCVSSGYQKA